VTGAELVAERAAVAVEVRAARPEDRAEWARHFRAYREFYRLPADEQVVDRVWEWIGDDRSEVNALVALVDGRIAGIAHYRAFARPSTGTTGLYLDDLYTDEGARGAGVGRALIRTLEQLAEREGHTVLRWITAEDNARARRLYDSVAGATRWVTYDLVPGAAPADSEEGK
jgi:GNAT superfamily N-acetyltransferase